MKLKTLKDIDIWHHHKHRNGCKWVTSKNGAEFRSELRQEAIKWVKAFGRLLNEDSWMEFFNITKSELKDEKK